MTETVINETVNQQEVSIEERSLIELLAKVDDLQATAKKLLELRQEDMFHFLSKKTRNEMARILLDSSDAVLEAARASFRNLKRDKRVRVPDEVCDQLILANRPAAISIGRLAVTEPTKDDETDDQS